MAATIAHAARPAAPSLPRLRRRLAALEAARFDTGLLPPGEVFLELGPAAGKAPLAGRLAACLRSAGLPLAPGEGGPACLLDAAAFLPRLGEVDRPAAALAAALFLVSGARAVPDAAPEGPLDLVPLGSLPPEPLVAYLEDRLAWLHANADLVGPLRAEEAGCAAVGSCGWPARLAERFREDFGERY